MDEIPKYHKKKLSSTSRASEKSKHKHDYTPCLLINDKHPYRAKYCRQCGKIIDVHFFETKQTAYGRLSLEDEEIFEKYKDLEQLQVDDLFQKYISINRTTKQPV